MELGVAGGHRAPCRVVELVGRRAKRAELASRVRRSSTRRQRAAAALLVLIGSTPPRSRRGRVDPEMFFGMRRVSNVLAARRLARRRVRGATEGSTGRGDLSGAGGFLEEEERHAY